LVEDHKMEMNSEKKLKRDLEDGEQRTKVTKVIPQTLSSAPALKTTEKSTKSATKHSEVRKSKIPKPASKSLSSSPEPEPSISQDEDEYVHLKETDGEEDVHLHGFSTDDDDSSDEDDAMNDEPSVFDVSKLPTIAKDDVIVKRKLEKARRQPVRSASPLFSCSPCLPQSYRLKVVVFSTLVVYPMDSMKIS
jgi:hypothetical protein